VRRSPRRRVVPSRGADRRCRARRPRRRRGRRGARAGRPRRVTRVGLTLPSFVDDPEEVVRIALAAEAADLDAVFVYDHLFRRTAKGERRPALDGVALLGALASETTRITIGALVFRAWLRPAATLGVIVETVARLG